MVKHQNRYITNEEKFETIKVKLNQEINDVESAKYQEQLRKLIDESKLQVTGGDK